MRATLATIISLAAYASMAAAEDSARITLLDGTQITAQLVELTVGGFLISQGDQRRTITLDEVQSIRFPNHDAKPSTPAPLFVLTLNDEARLLGRLRNDAESTAAWSGPLSEQWSIPLRRIAGIRRTDVESTHPKSVAAFNDAMTDRRTGQDILVSLDDENVRSVRGTLIAVGPEGGRFLFGERERTFRWEAVCGLALAEPAVPPQKPHAVIELIDGQSLTGDLTTGENQFQLTTDWLDQPISLQPPQISAINLRNDRVVYLSDLTPTAESSEGILHAGSPMRPDRNVANETMRLSGREFTKGLGVHAMSTLTYRLDGAYATFAATIGIDDAVRPRGSVVFIVQGDNKELFRSQPITGKDQAQDITIDITGIDELKLIVDYADELDLSDFADWANARVVKPKDEPKRRR